MAKNLKALTKSELDYLTEKYSFDILDNYIVVSCKGYDRKVLHDIDKAFSINTPVRKIQISELAIKMWRENFKANYNLLAVQNAISSLIVTYQDVSLEDVKKILVKGSSLITIV